MAKIEHVHHRLERWALWISKGRSLGGGSSSCAMWLNVQVDCDEVRQPSIPLDEAECSRTEAHIKALPDPLGETVACYYLHDSDHTRKRLAISSSVLSQRIDRAHRMLDEAFGQEHAPSPVAQQLPRGWLAD